DETAGESIKRRKDQNGGLSHRVKHHVKQDKNNEEDNGHNQLEALFGAQFELVFAGPFVGVPGRKSKLLPKHFVGLRHKAAVIGCLQVNVNVACERGVLIADHGGSARERDLGHFANRDLSAARSRDQKAA